MKNMDQKENRKKMMDRCKKIMEEFCAGLNSEEKEKMMANMMAGMMKNFNMEEMMPVMMSRMKGRDTDENSMMKMKEQCMKMMEQCMKMMSDTK